MERCLSTRLRTGNVNERMDPATGLHRVIEQVEDSIAGGELGVISMVTGGNGHAVVPYPVEPVGDRTRIYVYDCNREYFSFSEMAFSRWVTARSNELPDSRCE